MATIIKATEARRQSSGKLIQPVPFHFGEMADQATHYIEQVREQAAQILKQAQQQAEAIRKKAEEQGRQAALASVQDVLDARVDREIATLLPALHEAIDQIQQARHVWADHWQQSAIRLAAAMAARIVRRELACDPQVPLQLVREALQLAAGSAEITLRMNPQDHQRLGQQVERLVSELGRLAPTRIVADSAITAGGCRAETQFGVVDQQLEAQLERIAQELS